MPLECWLIAYYIEYGGEKKRTSVGNGIVYAEDIEEAKKMIFKNLKKSGKYGSEFEVFYDSYRKVKPGVKKAFLFGKAE